MPENSNEVQPLIQKKELWFKLSRNWKGVHWFIGILGITMSALAAAGDVSGKFAQVFSVIAAICFGIIGFSNPEKQALRYLRGYLLLDPAILKYQASLIPLKELYEVLERAEAVVHQEDADSRRGPGPSQAPPSTVRTTPGNTTPI